MAIWQVVMAMGTPALVPNDEFDAEAFDAFESAGWEARAGAYHEFFTPITSRLNGPLEAAGGIRRGTRVLDVATGSGSLAAACAARGAVVIGVDIAPEMVRRARGLHPDVDFRVADAQALPFDGGSFDAVLGNFAILHLARPEQAVGEFARVLAPGGRLALSTWDAPDRCRLAGVFADAVAEAGAPPPADVPAGPSFFRFSSESEFRALLAGAGLSRIHVETVAFAHHLPDADALWDGLLAATVRTRAMVLHQPPQLRQRIRTIYDRLVREHLTDHGLQIPVSVKIASAQKPPT